MRPAQRKDVVATANYLRHVRPIDPEEIREYVEGTPHSDAVRQVLREQALELGLVERDDGTFVPATDDPVPPLAGPVERLPQIHADRLEGLLVECHGTDWHRGDAGGRLRAAVRRIKEAYHRGRPVDYDADAALAYACYHLPGYYAAIQYVLDCLTEQDLLGNSLRVLDVGAGVGGPALGLFDYLPDDALVGYEAVEPSAAAADVLEAMLEGAGRNVHATVHRASAEAFHSDGPYDLIVFANVLSELDDPVAVVLRHASALDGDGSLILLAPADRNTAIGLREVERAVTNGLGVYAPTIRLWPGAAPTDRCWSFDARPDLEVPNFQRRLDDAGGGSGEFVNVDVQFAYAVLRPDGRRRLAFVPDPRRVVRLADSEDHVTERIDCAVVKLSRDLGGDNPVFLIGDGSQRVDHFAVLVEPSLLNADLADADYGDLLLLENVLALWNDDEAAYNLVVDGESAVERVEP